MRSKTKLVIDPETIKKLFDKAGIPGAENIVLLGAGEYNSVYTIDAALLSVGSISYCNLPCEVDLAT